MKQIWIIEGCQFTAAVCRIITLHRLTATDYANTLSSFTRRPLSSIIREQGVLNTLT